MNTLRQLLTEDINGYPAWVRWIAWALVVGWLFQS